VALDLLKNANIAAGGVLPMCQDTGTAIVMGKKGQFVFTGGGDEARSRAASTTPTRRRTCATRRWRRSTCTRRRTPAQPAGEIEIYAVDGDEYKFLFMAKGGGSANKSYLYQETKALLNEGAAAVPRREDAQSLGTAACPPYHLAVVIGGTSAEFALKTAKLASARYLDSLPTTGIRARPRVPRPRTRAAGAEARPDDRHRRAVRRQVLLPRRARHPPAPPRRLCPVAIAVSCSADRQALGKITATACSSSSSRRDPARFLPEVTTRSDLDTRRRRAHRPEPADERDPRRAVEVPGEDAPDR
jgi:fumarate hydratase, class I